MDGDHHLHFDEDDLQRAGFRYRLIAEILEADAGAITAAARAAAEREYSAPGGRLRTPSLRTLWRWVHDYRQGGLLALCPKPRSDRGALRAFAPAILEQAVRLRREGKKNQRATRTILDILQRQRDGALHPEPLRIARSTLDRHFARLGVSRRQLHVLGERPFTRIETQAPLELVVADFHHGPFVRVGLRAEPRRALLGAFIDHFSRYVPESRYYLHEDFAALRFGLRRLLAAYGLVLCLYCDRGSSFQSHRFHAACSLLGIRLVHSKAYVAESRGVIERFNQTLKNQFEAEVWERDELLTLEELNASYQAWLGERYHRDVHSETGQTPLERFHNHAVLRPAPDPAQLDELLRLYKKLTVHRKWSVVEVQGIRYSVDAALRRRKVGVLYDPFAPEYVLITVDRQVVQRAFPQKAGERFAAPKPDDGSIAPRTDYLALLRRDHERRTQAELAALRLAPAPRPSELSLADLVALLEGCRGARLSHDEQAAASAFWRAMRPIPAAAATEATQVVLRRQGSNLHLSLYLDAIRTHLVRMRTQKGVKP